MLHIDTYIRAESPAQAYELCQKKSSVILGGMLWLKQQHRRVQTAIDLCDLHLDQIEDTGDAYRIGAMVSLRAMETHAGLNALCSGAMADALRFIVGVQFRNIATVGGSVFGRFGFSDVLTILMALNARVELYHAGILPIADFAARGAGRDVLLYIYVPKMHTPTVYLSRRNTATDFPIMTTAVAKGEEGFRFVIGARPLRAVCLMDKNGILTSGITEESARALAEDITPRVVFSGNRHGAEDYRRQLCQVQIRRALMEWTKKGGC